MKLIKKFAGSLALITMGASFSVHADDVYRPAMFDFDDAALTKALSLSASEIGAKTHVLYCQAEISASGKASNASCYDDADQASLVTATQKSISELPFSHAQANGNAVPVRMSFRIVYSGARGEFVANAIPNLGTMHTRYGRDYVAPQERLDVSDWYDKYAEDSAVIGDAFLGKGSMARVAATVSETGHPSAVRTVESERAYKRDAKVVKSALKQSRFIPGFVRGKAVPMGYLAVVNYAEERSSVASSK